MCSDRWGPTGPSASNRGEFAKPGGVEPQGQTWVGLARGAPPTSCRPRPFPNWLAEGGSLGGAPRCGAAPRGLREQVQRWGAGVGNETNEAQGKGGGAPGSRGCGGESVCLCSLGFSLVPWNADRDKNFGLTPTSISPQAHTLNALSKVMKARGLGATFHTFPEAPTKSPESSEFIPTATVKVNLFVDKSTPPWHPRPFSLWKSPF